MSKLAKALMLAALSARPTRRLLNQRYDRMSRSDRTRFHGDYAKLFTRYRPPVQNGSWTVSFAGSQITIPLRRESMWLDWDVAASIVAHDPEIKDYYESLARTGRPSLFFDVGANYGTHSVLMASMGVEVVAFEPNSTCIAYGEALAAANHLAVRWEHVAVGAERGSIVLGYPREATWLGTTTHALDDRTDLVRETVALVPLDDHAMLANGRDVLIKIDVEGLELAVLKGAEEIIGQGVRILFESNDGTDRAELFDFFSQRGYRIAAPPFGDAQPLTAASFKSAEATNFLAWRP